MTLRVADFLQRWLLHVPVPQTRVVRCYGLYHHTHAEAPGGLPHGAGQPPVEVPRVWTGRHCVLSVARPIRSGVPPAASCWCAPRSSRVGAPHRRCWQRHVLHEGLAAGDSLPGAWCACC